MQIIHHEITQIHVDSLQRHPHNRPLGVNREKIDQLKESIRQYGFYDSQPLTVRKLPENGTFQIIKGEHRYLAASELGFTELPCSVQEMTDEEALIQLIIGNIQTENHPLEIGLNALQVVRKDSKQGLSAASYGEKIGLSRKVVANYLRAASVYDTINKQCNSGVTLLIETAKLNEISKLPEQDWCWLHDFVVEHECSKQQVIVVVKALCDFREKNLPEGFKAPNPETIARDMLLIGESRTLRDFLKFAERFQETVAKLDNDALFYEFSVEQNTIISSPANLFDRLCELIQKAEQTVNAVNQAYKALLTLTQQHSKKQAEAARDYYQDEKNRLEREELKRIETETKQVIIDGWIDLISTEKLSEQTGKTVNAVESIITEYQQAHALDDLHFVHGDFQDVCKSYEDDSIDVILSDPPYPKEYLPLYADLAKEAARILKPGGSCFLMVGQSYLPELFDMLKQHLTYHWTLAYLTPGGQAVQLWDREVNTFWKPILWFAKGKYTGKWIGDVAKSDVNDNDKRFHEWGQSVSGMLDLVNRCTEEGQLILDPFCGAGTTGVAAKKCGRAFIGIDNNLEKLKIARRRVYGI